MKYRTECPPFFFEVSELKVVAILCLISRPNKYLKNRAERPPFFLFDFLSKSWYPYYGVFVFIVYVC